MAIIKTTGGGGGGSGASFTTIQVDTGTNPVATGSDVLTLTSPVLDVAGNALTDTVDFKYKAEVDHGNLGSTETFDFSVAPAHYGNLNANCTVTLSNPTSGGAYVLLIEADGSSEVTWPTITWLTFGGAAPSIATLADGQFCIVNLYYSGTKAAYIGTYSTPT